ncbi:MAG: hypothetical protein HFH57_03700 [Lachnospiraceae bacterium]|jgi:hypothetical protein|nr:hypothetical protein [Lachnospiraceae bacterium]
MKLGYDRDTWEKEGFKEPIVYDQHTLCSIRLSGSSGSGKTISLLYSMYHLEPCILFFYDFKGDFKELQGCRNYKSGDDVVKALEDYYEEFQKARRHEYVQERQNILVIDEYAALVSFLDKKSGERIKTIVQTFLMLGRGVQKGFGTWICSQRADSSLFPGGARENFMIIQHMGRSTPEDWRMNFPGIERPDMDYGTSQGIVWADGYSPRNILIPHITNIDRLISGVKDHLNGIW